MAFRVVFGMVAVVCLSLSGLTTGSGACGQASSLPCLGDPDGQGTRELVAWNFENPGDLEGWTPNGDLADVGVAEGILHLRSVGSDPILMGPVFEIAATPFQWIELRMRSDRAGKAEFFWTHTLEGPFGGFSSGRETLFTVRTNQDWETYRVWPFWHTEGKIVRLRFDSFAETTLDIDSIRLMECPPPSSSATRSWEARQENAFSGWFGLSGLDRLDAGPEGLCFTKRDGPAIVMTAPPLIDLSDCFYANLLMRSQGAKTACIRWATDSGPGLGSRSFRLVEDDQIHLYNVDMSSSELWTGHLIALGIESSGPAGSEVQISQVSLGQDPAGGVEIEVAHFGPEDAVPRVGQSFGILLGLRNRAGQGTDPVRVRLQLPEGLQRIGGPARVFIPAMKFGDREFARWQVRGDREGSFTLQARLEGKGLSQSLVQTSVTLSAPPPAPRTGEFPPPEPAHTDYDIGAYYFPGWNSPGRWLPILETAPERKPVLGWYDESLPEVADWQIKWSVEHGIRFYLVDWYWDRGARSLDHWLHTAYGQSKYRGDLQYALMWANHNGEGSHSFADWVQVTRYWIDHYFPMKEYYRIDDRPAVYIWAPSNIRRDIGGTEEAARLYAKSQEMARAAGFKGIFFVAMSDQGDASACLRLQREGYEGFTSYHTFEPVLSRAENPKRFPYEQVMDLSSELWETCRQRSSMLYMPVVDTGWSSGPWHGEDSLAITDRTPELFQKGCQMAREYLDAHQQKIAILGPVNEWGEGSYIEPCTEYGFSMLDAVREAFCDPSPSHQDLTPRDVCVGPYDLPVEVPRALADWTFDQEDDLQGWTPMMGLGHVAVKSGVLSATTASSDPAFTSPGLRLPAHQYPRLRMILSLQSDKPEDRCQIFWTSNTSPATSEANSVSFPVISDGRMREYDVELSSTNRWRGMIHSLRVDPCDTPGVDLKIDEIRLRKK